MDLAAYRDEIKLKLTGYVLDLELDDCTLDKIINSALREIQRYIDVTQYETIPFSRCIDLNPRKINMIAKVFRSSALMSQESDRGSSTSSSMNISTSYDPVAVSQWQLYNGNNYYYNSNYVQNIVTYTTNQQIYNTLSTDMAFRYDRVQNKLYINVGSDIPKYVTIEYVPRYDNVEQIVSDFWIDIIIKLSVALTKVTLGRIRSRFTQSGALWTQDGEAILAEGNQELSDIREKLKASTQLVYGID